MEKCCKENGLNEISSQQPLTEIKYKMQMLNWFINKMNNVI